MLPDSIPTVQVTACYLAPDGTPLTGTVEFRPPALLTHSATDVFVGGPTRVALDSEGRIALVLPATDADGWNPVDWTYQVTEKLGGLSPRSYQIALPAALSTTDLADVRPADPNAPDYVAVPGPPGPQGELGPQGPAGPVRSVNGLTDADVVLTAADIHAVDLSSVGVASGVAALDADGLVPAAQLPSGGGGVSSVNGRTGDVTLTAADLSALTEADADQRYLAIDGSPVTSVNGRTGNVTLTAADVSSVAAGDAVLLDGDQTVAGAKTFAVPPSTTIAPTSADHLTRRGYVDQVSAAGTWTPAAMGFLGWSFDPAASSASSAQYCQNGYVYLIGVPLAAAATVKDVVFYVPGYVGGTLSTSSYAGLYRGDGTRVGVTARLTTLFTATEGTTVVCPLTGSYSAAAGSYWVAVLVNGPSSPGNGPAFLRGASVGGNPGGSARMPGSFVRHGRLSSTGQTSLPASFSTSSIVADANAIWAALA